MLTVSINEQGSYDIYDRSGTFMVTFQKALGPMPTSKADSGMSRLIHRLEHLVRFQATRTLSNPRLAVTASAGSLVDIQVLPSQATELHGSGVWLHPVDIKELASRTYELHEMTLFSCRD